MNIKESIVCETFSLILIKLYFFLIFSIPFKENPVSGLKLFIELLKLFILSIIIYCFYLFWGISIDITAELFYHFLF